MQPCQIASRAVLPSSLGFDGEVDHHDGVLLDDAEQHDDADEGVEVELLAEEHQRQQRAEDGGRQSRENRDRMNEALVQNAEHDVDDENRDDQQDRQVLERLLELLHGSLEAGGDRRGHARVSRMARPRAAAASPSEKPGCRLKRDRRRGKLAEVVDAQRSHGPAMLDHRVERHQRSVPTTGLQLRKRFGVALIFRLDFENHRVLIGRRVDRRDLAAAV